LSTYPSPRRHTWALSDLPLDCHDILHALLESTTCGGLLVDREHRILQSNAVFDAAVGAPRGTAVERPGAEVLSCPGLSNRTRGCAADDLCLACSTWELVDRALRKNREQRRTVGVELETRSTVHVVEVEVRVSALGMADERFAIVILGGLDRLREFRRWTDEGGMHGILGTDPKMFELFETIRRVGRSDVPVLIQGETGSGKEMVALALHRESARRDGPLVSVNCGALPPGLLESELFGHVEGAFTGASRPKQGRFELAHGGTIFLDEIGELSLDMQVALLRVLQDGTFERVGAERTCRTDARVLCATNWDLERAVSHRRFRKDLFYRLAVVPLTVPSLRQRPGDIPLLAEHLLAKAAEEYDKKAPELSRELVDLLTSYPWPGNVRELENAMCHALITSASSRLLPEHMPRLIAEHARRPPRAVTRPGALDQAAVARALRTARGNRSRTARLLGVSRATLYRYLEKWQEER